VLFVAIGVAQLVASVSFYQAIDEQTLHEDHARRVAELLVVSNRVFQIDPTRTPSIMTSGHLEVSLAAQPTVARPPATAETRSLARQIVRWEPRLASRPLHLAISRAHHGRRDLVGSMQLAPGRWLNFQSRDISSMWPIALRATWMTLVTTLLCLVIGLLALRLLTLPLRRLSEAARQIGRGRPVAIREGGPADVRDLAHAMNEMQDRIARLLADQAKSFEAISHDLRTPLSRQKVAAELVDDEEVSQIMLASVDEMDAMLDSLQQFLRAQHLAAEPERVDLNALLAGMVAPLGDHAIFAPVEPAEVATFREPLTLSLAALIENARRFGDKVEVRVEHSGRDWFVEIEDDGPGIPAQHLADVLTPFFRVDEARGRNTKGFGLGIPTAHRLLTRFGGGISFVQGPGEGLTVRVLVPRPA